MSLPKLTALSTQTLSLILERQRLLALPSSSPSSATHAPAQTLHLPQITKNFRQMHGSILELEAKEGNSAAVELLRNQYERMRAMLGMDADLQGVESLPGPSTPLPTVTQSVVPLPAPPPPTPPKDPEPLYRPYTDDPEAGYEPGIMLQTRRRMMDEQDTHLEQLSHSINRQHDISLQINDELDVHTGLLEGLDTDVDNAHGRLSGARRRLDRVARGARENGSTVTIGLLISVLLVLIIVFKT